MRTTSLSGILLVLALGLLLPTGAPAAVVGHITQMEGKVDLLKKGQLPATQVKLQDGLETGDVIRTKSLSRAQITFIDQSTLTIAPESRIAIETYMVDESKGKRNAVLKMFQGLALAVVSKIYQSEEPNFVVKTQTAIMGIRGTEVGIRLYPNYSEFLNFEGRTRVQSLFPEIQGVVELNAGQGTRVNRGLPPTMPFGVSAEDRQQFIQQLTTGLNARTRSKDSGSESSQGNDPAKGPDGLGTVTIVATPPLLEPATQETVAAAPRKVKEVVPPPPPPPPPVTPPPPPPPPPPVTPPPPPPPPPVTPPPPPPPPPVTPPPPTSGSVPFNGASFRGTYNLVSKGGHHSGIFTGALTFTNIMVNYKVVAQDPSSPGTFVRSSSGNITWTLAKTDLTLNPDSGYYYGKVKATGVTEGGTVFIFYLQVTSADGKKLAVTNIGAITGNYATSPTMPVTYDFTSPGSSHKITTGTATISWTPVATVAASVQQPATLPVTATLPALVTAPTAVVAPPVGQNVTVPLATAVPVTTPMPTATSLSPVSAISAVNTLPPSPIITPVTVTPGAAIGGTPVGPQVSPVTPDSGTSSCPAGGPAGLPSVTDPPGLSAGGPPGLSKGGPPGLSKGGPPGQLKNKGK